MWDVMAISPQLAGRRRPMAGYGDFPTKPHTAPARRPRGPRYAVAARARAARWRSPARAAGRTCASAIATTASSISSKETSRLGRDRLHDEPVHHRVELPDERQPAAAGARHDPLEAAFEDREPQLVARGHHAPQPLEPHRRPVRGDPHAPGLHRLAVGRQHAADQRTQPRLARLEPSIDVASRACWRIETNTSVSSSISMRLAK